MPIRVGAPQRGAAGSKRSRRPTLVVAVVLALMSLVGCRVDTTVAIDVAANGSGTVSVDVVLDEEASRRWGDDADRMRTEDLVSAGWTVVGPQDRGAGTVISVSKPFRGPDDLEAVLAEVASSAVLRDWKLVVDDGFGSTTYRLSGRVMTAGDRSEFSDSDVAAALDGLPLGLSPEELTDQLGPQRDAMSLTVEARLPGSTPRRVVVNPGSGVAESKSLSVSATERDGRVGLLGLLAGVVAAAAVALFAFSFRRVSVRAPSGDPASDA